MITTRKRCKAQHVARPECANSTMQYDNDDDDDYYYYYYYYYAHMPRWRYGGLSRSTCFVVQETPWQGTASCSDQRLDPSCSH